jgi:hypothetical protein
MKPRTILDLKQATLETKYSNSEFFILLFNGNLISL